MKFDSLIEKQMHCWKGYKKKGTKKLPSGKVVNNCVKESFDDLVESVLLERRYKVTHVGLGVSGETDVDIEDEKKAKTKAKQNVFFRLKKEGKLSNDNALKWKEASAKAL